MNAHSGIERPEDLRGRRVGTIELNVTALVWVRGLLAHEYGVRSEEIEWYLGGQKLAGQQPLIGSVSPGLRVQVIPADRSLEQMLELGELDAIVVPDLPDAFVAGSPVVRRLFTDFQAVEADYYRRTRLFPVMHCVVLRQDVFEQVSLGGVEPVRGVSRGQERRQPADVRRECAALQPSLDR